MHPWGKEAAAACPAQRVHARLHSTAALAPPPADLPYLPGFSVGIFPLRGFHCSPGAGRVSRTGFWSKRGSLVEMRPKVFWKSTMEEEF